MKRVSRGCGSCPHYDGLADRCAYPGRGCVKDAEKPVNTKSACPRCQYMNRQTGQCAYPGYKRVELKDVQG